eukprot:TRINITY_DN18808_c0_g1_i3.p1 TRINITY_DN18808_c0_g1~~TRINITY_DN18808_c0_g1_i3.p1  ORF type:complete len:218 (-),score=12.34 TRINITY_DN18808_c0_g1_i3:17-670(-)
MNEAVVPTTNTMPPSTTNGYRAAHPLAHLLDFDRQLRCHVAYMCVRRRAAVKVAPVAVRRRRQATARIHEFEIEFAIFDSEVQEAHLFRDLASQGRHVEAHLSPSLSQSRTQSRASDDSGLCLCADPPPSYKVVQTPPPGQLLPELPAVPQHRRSELLHLSVGLCLCADPPPCQLLPELPAVLQDRRTELLHLSVGLCLCADPTKIHGGLLPGLSES